MKCVEHEKVLEESLEHWWDHELKWTVLLQVCEKVQVHNAYIGMILKQKVFFKCCGFECEPAKLLDAVSEVDFLLGLVAEVAALAPLPNMVFLFNTGDQPFLDKAFWAPVPQLHWVRSAGHWTIPLPNPFHLKAYAKNLLGDSIHSHHVPWENKIAKVFWRGSLSAPDNFIFDDIAALPRVRLLTLAKEHPQLFDVGITNIEA